MEKIIFISFPRTNNLLLVRFLKFLFKDDFCSQYHNCGTVPCTCNPQKKLSKTFDFELDIPITDDNFYMYIENEDKIKNIEYYFHFWLFVNNIHEKNYSKYNDKIQNIIQYYDKLHKKYSTKMSNILHVYSQDFEKNPQETLNKVFLFLKPVISIEKIQETKEYINELSFQNYVAKKSENDLYDYIKNFMNQQHSE